LAISDWVTRFVVLAFILAPSLGAQGDDNEFRVYTEHPRLILTPQRLRLLKREREGDSQRWRQFDSLVKGAGTLPEPGFGLALYYAASGDNAIGQRAVQWALSPAADDLRQLALVYDWCQPVLGPKESATLAAKIRQLIQKRSFDTVPVHRDKILAWIAIADDAHSEEAALEQAVRHWWRMEYATSLEAGPSTLALPDVYPLLEILHAIRDNLRIDLREAAPGYFAHLAKYLVMGNYPAPYRAPDNEFRIPMDLGGMDRSQSQPDLNRAALARTAGLSMVAYDNNGLENQFLQGWLIQDRFSLLTSFGAPYEYLWANPYQPGLSYFLLPLVFHDENSGALFVRSSWEEDADWFGLYGGQAQVFHGGRVRVVNQTTSGPAAAKPGHLEPMQVGETSIIFGRAPFQFSTEGGTVLAIGLEPRHPYLVETDDEEMRETATDRAGTLVLEYPASRAAGVRVHEGSGGSAEVKPEGKPEAKHGKDGA
jgi:hypothetical protein